MEKLKVSNFSLFYTLDCGQFFLYELLEDGFYYIIFGQKVFKIRQKRNIIYFLGISKDELIYFFSLDVDLKVQTLDFNVDKYLNLALEEFSGLRLIRQDTFSCIISFICSSASNIAKIKNSLRLICKTFGEEVIFEGKKFSVFPKSFQIDDFDKLLECKVGYRGKYIFEFAKFCAKNPDFLNRLNLLPYSLAKSELINFKGVGEKVADCICLFCLNHLEAFPIDTWILKIISKLYLIKEEKPNISQVRKFIESYFGSSAGLKQQYLFYYARKNLKK